jgi:hypothetical protein
MEQRNNQEQSFRQDYENSENRSEQDADYGNSSEVENPNPSTATPSIPSEVPIR